MALRLLAGFGAGAPGKDRGDARAADRGLDRRAPHARQDGRRGELLSRKRMAEALSVRGKACGRAADPRSRARAGHRRPRTQPGRNACRRTASPAGVPRRDAVERSAVRVEPGCGGESLCRPHRAAWGTDRPRRCLDAEAERRRLGGVWSGRGGRGSRSRGRARAMVDGRASAARLSDAARGQARLSHALCRDG